MFMKILLVVIFCIIIFSLGSAVVYLLRGGEEDSKKMAKALTWRIALSIGLFVFLIVAFSLGWLHPQTTIVV